jgi:PTH1 family peptidyl-tRNA hydrolase
MHYIVALGNPGRQYEGTRHNLGWQVADALVVAAALPPPRVSTRYQGRLSEGMVDGLPVTILYPDTYMNNSGQAVATLVPKDQLSRLIVVHDEAALPLGQLRLSKSSGAAGHNGVASIIESLGTNDFIRLRLGIGAPPPGEPLDQFVLERFLPEEETAVSALLQEGVAALELLLTRGVETAMNEVNR